MKTKTERFLRSNYRILEKPHTKCFILHETESKRLEFTWIRSHDKVVIFYIGIHAYLVS